MVLSITLILTDKYQIDTSGLELFGVALGKVDLSGPLLWTLVTLWISLAFNWWGDLTSLGKWNSSVITKLAETPYGGGGKMKPRIEFILQNFERVFDDEDKKQKKADVDFVKRYLEDIQESLWWHERLSVFYVVVWSFLVPTVLAVWSVWLVWHA
jgi:hypothetical protein